ncbi:trophozoite cysteine proteinase-like [Diabrotica virgifera virgifera]|uniref:Cathepsin L1-like n=1 Tax=Diabrotica virgifera virgifera TaxID=50390 RepID=A0ABM5L331_DIAVI|nr:trophozoite cysteine proteinase-like [Diabrotica virgifera virgifera]
MKVFIAIAAFIAVISAGLHEDYEEWISYKAEFSKKYGLAEDKFRFQLFQKKLREIEQHNEKYEKGEIGWSKGINQFSDWTDDEFESILNKQLATTPVLGKSLGVYEADPNEPLPASVDWREKGAVLPVRYQGGCGACWAFSVTGTLEGQVAIHKKQNISLSPQDLIDCTRNYGNWGCKGGGPPSNAYKYVMENGISSEADYPYLEKDDICKNNTRKAITKISGWRQTKRTEKDLISAIAKVGPISVGVGVKGWRDSRHGVHNNTDCGPLNHAVLAVGYTEEYFIVKNSWGPKWGDNGYIRIARGNNICHINEACYYPVLSMNTKKEKVNWLNIKWLRFDKEKPSIIQYKYCLSQENFEEIEVNCKGTAGRKRTSTNLELNQKYLTGLPVSHKKKKDLEYLLNSKVIPDEYSQFIKDIPVSTNNTYSKKSIMKLFVVIACLIAAIFAELKDDYEQWIDFKTKFNRHYGAKENEFRFKIFQKNLRDIEEHNAKYEKGEEQWTKGVNQFSDWTEEQLQSLLNHRLNTIPLRSDSLGVYKADPNEQLPASLDWREKGAVLAVRDQGWCGGCWAFSAIAALEGQVAIHKKQKIPLSPQNLIDCSTENKGCNGGLMNKAFEYIKSHGISSEEDYPFIEKDDNCRTNVTKVLTSISGYKGVNTEQDLISAIAKVGPVSVAVATGKLDWFQYKGGIFNKTTCGTTLDHGVTAVGYTDEYIIIKNSWGPDWGEAGYIRLARGLNMCGINNKYNYYPIL